jgi:acyl carrier protein
MIEKETNQLREELIKQVSDILSMDPAKIDPEIPLIRYGMDSLTFFNVSYEFEDKYGINIFSEQMPTELTINKLVHLIKPHQE